MRLLPCGPRALLVEVDGLAQARRLAGRLHELREHPDGVWTRVSDIVPAARTVLVRLTGPDALPELSTALRTLAGQDDDHLPEPTTWVHVDVTYDGADLAEAAELIGLTPDELVDAHTQAAWQVAFCGFCPGFGYLVGDDDRLDVPRRPTPRTRVPAGAVALAGRYTGVYPRQSPGGWQLIGRTTAPLWKPDRDPPALFRPGVGVRFRALG